MTTAEKKDSKRKMNREKVGKVETRGGSLVERLYDGKKRVRLLYGQCWLDVGWPMTVGSRGAVGGGAERDDGTWVL